MRRPRRPTRLLLGAAAVVVLAAPAPGLASEPATTSAPITTSAASSPAPTGTETSATATTTVEAPAPTSSAPSPPLVATPHVKAQHAQGYTPAAPPARGPSGPSGESTGASPAAAGSGIRAPSPSTLTPALPFGLESSIAGVPGFFIESFRIPPFLLPIYQAAGTAYGIPWQVLAAINEVETDYGRDLSVSSAGAEGWMQFLPSSWSLYGVDANGDGFKDPYNPADAIFAAARYLRAAGGERDIRSAVYAYNHSQAYVSSVMLRAQLLGGTPSELLGAITGLTEARFPVHAFSHFSDGFPLAGAGRSGSTTSIPGTTIYSLTGAPVVAVQDGEIVQIGSSPTLGRYVSLRDAYGNTYTYAQLGDVSSLYPVLAPHAQSTVSRRIVQPGAAAEPAPDGPATAGAQPRSPISAGAAVSGFAQEAGAALEVAPSPTAAQPPAPGGPSPKPRAAKVPRIFREGPNDVFLHPLRAGAQVISGTVLGHIGGAGEGGPHMLFQIRPAGQGAPLIDPKPILDGWVALENSSIFRAKGENPFLATSPSVGQVLLESKQQLEPQVLHDASIHLSACGRQDVQTGRLDRRVLTMLEYLSVSGVKPTVSGIKCDGSSPAGTAQPQIASTQVAVSISAVNGIPIAGHQGAGSIADTTVRKLLMLEGAARPHEIVSLTSYPGAAGAISRPSARGAIQVAFSPLSQNGARGARFVGSPLSPSGWIRLIARLGEIPDPTVQSAHSSAAIRDAPATEGSGNGNH
jgi:murein DD-endopeptidase MepM/ murein hydrolase activator NlpD